MDQLFGSEVNLLFSIHEYNIEVLFDDFFQQEIFFDNFLYFFLLIGVFIIHFFDYFVLWIFILFIL